MKRFFAILAAVGMFSSFLQAGVPEDDPRVLKFKAILAERRAAKEKADADRDAAYAQARQDKIDSLKPKVDQYGIPAGLENFISERLKDPDSLKIKALTDLFWDRDSSTWIVKIWWNAKNGYGGYGEPTIAWYRVNLGEPIRLSSYRE